jgi:hypothetical protein
LGAAEALGQFDRFVDCRAVRSFRYGGVCQV